MPPVRAADLPVFVDVSSEAGLLADTRRSWGSPLWTDLDGDGDPDLVVPTHGPDAWVYRNNGNGSFSIVNSGLSSANLFSKDWHGFALGDYNGDGIPDLYVALGNPTDSAVKEDGLWRGRGDGSFIYETGTAHVQNNPGRGRAAFWFDYDGDGDLDVFVLNYSTPSRLYRNDGAAGFTDVGPAAAVNVSGVGGGVSLIDYQSDGRLDIFTSNYFLSNQGNGTFQKVTPAGLEKVRAVNMAWADFNRDGFPDLYAVQNDVMLSSTPQADRLYMSVGGVSFTDVTTSAGVNLPLLSTHASWADFDNDGWLDLFVLGTGETALDVGRKSRLYRNNGDGTFTDVTASAGLADLLPGQRPSSASWADYDGDGRLDLVIKYGHGLEAGSDPLAQGPIRIYRNLGNTNHYLKVALAGPAGNAVGIGARVELTTSTGTQYQQMTGGSHQYGQDMLPLHFGLGTASSAGLTVRWPSGEVQQFQEILGDRKFVAVQGVAPLQMLTMQPRTASPSTTVKVKIGGTGLSDTTAVSFAPSTGLTVTNKVMNLSSQLEVTLSVAAGSIGKYDLILTNADGQRFTRAKAFEVK